MEQKFCNQWGKNVQSNDHTPTFKGFGTEYLMDFQRISLKLMNQDISHCGLPFPLLSRFSIKKNSIEKNIEKRYLLRSIEKSFLTDPLIKNNAIYCDWEF